ncbi:hypothetical protein RclHR1_07030005 [Rhizophagus clarus]|uniref:BTB domain-containing protein n=1 Tax=Rhizophagus clarus TaxID=94130 RepID=A0A2Z6S7B4_9GLOM|nr:hypothetical protein RclHR1_07030005 [Rhizophagus clarus]GES76374.1 hypothetical protein GLOIN_2v1617035 [Rhizophagus clarus]
MSSEPLLNSLLQDLNKLYKDADDYDVIIQAGEGLKSEDFKAHSNILRVRSTYFKAALSSNWIKKEGDITVFKKPNIKPNIFKIILKYIYTGIISLDVNIVDFGELLVAADEINLVELINHIQNYIVKLNKEWTEKDIIKCFNILSCHQEAFNILYVYFREMISKNPERFFNDSNLFIELENNAFLSLIQNDDFDMEEIEIWDNLLKWAISKNPTVNSNTLLWESDEIEIIKLTIQEFIPYIRFFQISSQNYYYKIRPLSALLPKEVDEEIILHFLIPESSQNSKMLPRRLSNLSNGPSNIIKLEHIYLISNWIEKKQETFSKVPQYEFKLLLRGNRDGFDVKSFREKCYDKGATVVVFKLRENKIIGGYNPISWGGSGRYLLTDDSFIFSFHQSILNSSTIMLSRVKNRKNAIYDSTNNSHSFGEYDLEIFKKKCRNRDYETRIHENGDFEIEDYEVFQVIKKE